MPGIWTKTLIYLGLAEEEEDDGFVADDLSAEEPDRQPTSVRRVTEREPGPQTRGAVVRAMPTAPSNRLHLVHPSAFNDAQEVGDKFRENYSVIINLQSADPELARRLVDFASGLAYGLRGSMQPVADKVFLLTPPGVQVSAEERRRFLEERGFYNQA
jgi:cell division inhibitor SepF